MKNTAIFRTERFGDPSQVDMMDVPPPPGKECIEFLMKRVANRGVSLEFTEAFEGEFGWFASVIVGKHDFLVHVYWSALGRPPVDYWTILVEEQFHPLKRLFGRRKSPEALNALCDHLRQILEDEEDFTDVRWLTAEEFREIT